jgi:methylated-DNA-[protein]-cysteine S-methyltransferase
VQTNGESITKIRLFSSPEFEYKISGASGKLKEKIADWLNLYAKGAPPPCHLPLSWKGVTEFQRDIYEWLLSIPFGSTTYYAAFDPRKSRAVGNACGKNPFPLIVPCHRVLAKDGSLGGFTGGLDIKRALLAFEERKTPQSNRDLL